MRSILILCSLLLVVGACSSPKFDYPVREENPTKETILIGMIKGADSNFKRDIIKQLEADYSDNFNVRVMQIKDYDDVKDKNYAALIVMEQLKAWLWFNRGMKDIANRGDKKNTIFMVSVGDPKWRWKREDIKVITSATKKDKPSLLYVDIKNMLDNILER